MKYLELKVIDKLSTEEVIEQFKIIAKQHFEKVIVNSKNCILALEKEN